LLLVRNGDFDYEKVYKTERTMRFQIEACLIERIDCSPGVHGVTFETGVDLDFVVTSRSGRKVGVCAVGFAEGFSAESTLL